MIKFSGQQIVAHANTGTSDYLLVTFNQLDSPHIASDHYFMQPQVETRDISCVGVMTTEKGFFLSPEMDAVAKLVHSMRRGRKVVVFGQSMGGYAALKFSSRLGADFVIASAPYFSVHGDELELPDDRHLRILMRSLAGHGVTPRPEFAGMAIKPEDVSGRLVVLFDPAEMIDAFGAALIGKHMPQTEFITIPHAGHVIYDASWNADLAADLFRAVQSPDLTMMARTVCNLRRNRIAFLIRTLSKAANRKPRLSVAAMRAPRITRHPNYHALIGDLFNLRAIYLLAQRGETSVAAEHLAVVMRDYYGLQIRPADWSGGETAMDILARDRCLVMSCHGTFLTWSLTHDCARFEPHPFMAKNRLPIVASIRNDVAQFVTVENGVERPVCLSSGSEREGITHQDEIVSVDQHLIALRNGIQYLGALPDGGLHVLPAINHQQRLIVLPLQQSSALFERKADGWLDTVLVNQTTNPSRDRPAVVQRATQRWRRLFKKG